MLRIGFFQRELSQAGSTVRTPQGERETSTSVAQPAREQERAGTQGLPHYQARSGRLNLQRFLLARSLQGADNTERPTSSAPAQHEPLQKAIPHPSMLRDAAWGNLDPDLTPFVKARFSQELINQSYGIKPIAICTGLSIQWLKHCANESSQSMRENQVQRMLNLSSFDNMVHSKITHSFYRFEHKSKMEEACTDVNDLMMAGGRSVLSAAEIAGLRLQPVLRDDAGDETCGKLVVSGYSMDLDPSAVADVVGYMHEGDCGVVALMGTEQSHALGYAVRDGNIHLFDPNHGEFQFDRNDFPQVLNGITNSTHLGLVAMQLFKA